MRTWPWDIALALLGCSFLVCIGVLAGMMVSMR